MSTDRCPKDDPLRSINAEEVFEVRCPSCGNAVEFMAGDRQRKCKDCGEPVQNPRAAPNDAR